MNDLQLFANGEFELRMTQAGDSFRVAAPSLARDLGFHAAKDMLRTVPDTEKGWETAPTLGGDQKVSYVTESGFYRVLGQRQVARIKNEEVRSQVARFQDWVYRDVLPAIRRHGAYAVTATPASDDPFEPDAFSWRETCTIIRQQYEVKVSVQRLRRVLMMAGVLNQNFEPKAGFEHCFWFTGTAYLVFRHCVPAIFHHYQATERKLGAIATNKLAALESAYDQGNLFAIEGGAS